ncbi:unnamed protein product, partial [Musa textilis]
MSSSKRTMVIAYIGPKITFRSSFMSWAQVFVKFMRIPRILSSSTMLLFLLGGNHGYVVLL